MQIALRRTPANDASFVEKLTADAIKYKLATVWPHVGFIIDDVLYHSGGRHGLEKTELTKARWDIIDIGPELDEQGKRIFDELVAAGAKYDWIELFDFTLLKPFIKLAKKNEKFRLWLENNVYCYQLVLWVLTNRPPTRTATPELILYEINSILSRKLKELSESISVAMVDIKENSESDKLDKQFQLGNNDGG